MLAIFALVVMGEGAKQTPLALIRNILKIRFFAPLPTPEEKEVLRYECKKTFTFLLRAKLFLLYHILLSVPYLRCIFKLWTISVL